MHCLDVEEGYAGLLHYPGRRSNMAKRLAGVLDSIATSERE